MKWIFARLAVALFLILSQTQIVSAAPLFNVTASGVPANLSIKLCLNAEGPLSCQNVTVSALNLIITTTIPNKVYPLAGIQINTPGYTLADIGVVCTPLSNGMCQFSVSDTVAKAIAVNSTTVPQYAYITNTNPMPNTVFNCIINSTTGVLSNCGSSSTGLFNDANSIALNLASARAYITNFNSNTVTLCTIDNITGGLTGCANTPTSSSPRFITLNSTMTRAYVAGGTGVSLYSVNSGTGELTLLQHFNIGDASGIALNSAGTLAYVVISTDDTVQLCAIDETSGALITPCTSTGSGSTTPVFDGAQRITLNSIGTFAYVTNYGSYDITVCAIDSSSGNLNNCSRTAQGLFAGFANMAVNWSNTKAYVPYTPDSIVSLCSINADGTLSGCTNSGGTNFDGPKGVALG